MASANQCRRFIKEKSDEKLSEGARDYACGILKKAGAEPSNLPEDKAEKLVERARSWEKGTYGEFAQAENQQATQQQTETQTQAEPVEAPSEEQETLEQES